MARSADASRLPWSIAISRRSSRTSPAGLRKTFLGGPHQWRSIIYPEDLPCWRRGLERLRTGQDSQEEYRIVTPDGQTRWLRESVRVTRQADGNSWRLDGVLSDITERREADAQLQRERRLLRSLMDNLPDAIFITDSAGRYALDQCRPSALLRVDDEKEVIGKTVFDFFATERAARHHADDRYVMESGQAVARPGRATDRSRRQSPLAVDVPRCRCRAMTARPPDWSASAATSPA